LVCLVVLLLVALTWSRNQLWRDPIAFLQHEVEINNDSFTSYCFLGEAYYSAGQLTEAISIFERAQSYVDNLINRGNNTFESCYSNYAATLQEAGYLDEARQLISRMPVTAFTTQGQSKVAMTFGNVEALSGNFSEAEAHFNRARTLDPNNIYAVSNLAKLKILTGELQQSYELFIQVQKSDPGNMDAAIGLEYLLPLLRDNPQQ
jgi:tetratricopeptide (TPR) repeat protein